MAIRINLGCGRKYLEGFVNCDIARTVKADKYFDLEVFPYPFEANVADEILLDNVLEHLSDVPRAVTEAHRILKAGGLLRIIVPYAKSDWALQDPTHKHFFTEKTMDYFAEDFPCNFYSTARFKILKAQLTYDNSTLRHKLRNAIPFRSVLRYFLYNLYDGVYFEMQKI
jgi:predicted SAM-dependent methyltransferase